jgi:hypothetical protein
MKIRWIPVACASIVVPAFALLAASPAPQGSGGTGVGGFSSPTQNGDETIKISYKDANGANQNLETTTGQFGSRNKADDLTKGMGAAAKAEKIRDAINAASGTSGITATAAGGVVTVTPPAGGSITKFDVTNNTSEKNNWQKVHSFAAAGEAGNAEAHATFLGSPQGEDDDGNDAIVRLGTNRHVSEAASADFESARALCLFLVQDLVENGVAASYDEDCKTIHITIDEDLDERVLYGCSDVGLRQEVEFSLE